MQSTSITILGDICPTFDWQRLFDCGKTETLFGSVFQVLRTSDYCIANLECPVTNVDKKLTKCGPNQKAKPSDLGLLQAAGIKAVSLANNHIKDYCQQGILDTFTELDNRKIEWFGAGANANSIHQVLYKKFDGVTIGFASFAEQEFNIAEKNEAGALLFDPYDSFDLIRKWKLQCDYLVILYHGGIENYKYPSPLLQKKCRKMVSSGANLVLCQHSHCIGTMEEYNGCTILYGQGNSVFGYRKNNPTWNEGLLVQLIYDGESFSIELKLMRATENGLILADEESNNRRIEQFILDSKRICEEEYIIDSWKSFCEENRALYLAMLTGKSSAFNKINRLMNNRLLKQLYKPNKRMVSMNLIRCDAHKEIIQTLLENDYHE